MASYFEPAHGPAIDASLPSGIDELSRLTLAINPEVVVFEEDDGEIEHDILKQDVADQLIERTVDNLKDRGFEQVDKSPPSRRTSKTP